MTTIDILRDEPGNIGGLFVTIKPDNNSVQVKKVMGENQLNIAFEDARSLNFKINDYCNVFGEKYALSQIPVVTKISKYLFRYTLNMFAEGYDLTKAQFMFLGADNTLRESEFSLMGTTDDFVNLVIANANRVGSGWVKGQVGPSAYKNLTFSKENCYNALSHIAEEFDTEFALEGKTVHLVKRGNDTGHTYKHGRSKGLYEITRQTLNNSNIVTRLYAYGSEKNLPANYITNGKRLRLPGGYNPCLISFLTNTWADLGGGSQRFDFSWTAPLSSGVVRIEMEWRLAGTTDPWQNDAGIGDIIIYGSPVRVRELPNGTYEFRFRTVGATCSGINAVTAPVTITGATVSPIYIYTPLPYVERNVHHYGVIEYTEVFDDIFPHRTGTVSGVNIADIYEFTDAAIDFDVNAYLLPGLTAKVTFNTGQLAGYTFDVRSFDNTYKRFVINKNADERVLDIPSSSLKPAIGDQYVLTDIEMPSSYVTAAENELIAAANARLVELSEPQVSYTVVIDPKFIKSTGRTVKMGDLVWIVDDDLGLQKKIRISSVTRNIVNDYEYQMELSDIVSPGTIQMLVSAQQSSDRGISNINNQLLNNSILNNNVVGTLIFNNIPTTATMTGFENVVIETSTGKLHKKI